TKSMVENLEGFPESIKFLSQSKDWKQDASLLSDLIYVQEDYRVAIENYLDPYLNYYVVQNLEEAYQAIKLLNKTQKGKANFFLLDAFADYQPPMVMLPDTQRATELIETEPAYRNLVSYLLENVLLTDKEELQQNLDNDQITILTRSGGLIQRKFSLSGGSVGLFEGKKIGRKKNLEVLEVAISKAEREENRLSTQYYNLKKKLEQLRENTEEKDIKLQSQTLNQVAQEKVSLQTRMENFQSYLQENAQRQGSINERITELKKQNKNIDKDLKNWQEKVTATKEKIANTDGSYREIAEQLSQASTVFNEKNIEFIKQQNLVSTLQRELVFRERQLDENRASLKTSQLGIEQATLDRDDTLAKIDQLTKALQTAYENRKDQENTLTEAEQSYFKARGKINELDDQIRKVNRKRQETQILLNNLKEKQNDLRYQMTAISERLQIEFQIGINDVINQELTTSIPQQELQMKVERLKSRLDNYGEINPMAVEAYDEMNERYQSITTQRDDILKAKEDLLTTIQEIEETATTQFIDAFNQARLHFIEVFRSLFTADDTCDLILLDEENPLESKIEIVAKPKGKRPQAISQLSGGEKTLTATALLFALYLLKPAPFCIFDEVDAPLDDANIEKFNRIIKKFSEDSQFIIVTHNKQTMAAVDTIYGVFMQEQGVSAVNQVDFRNFGHTTLMEASN
ncbi:MAG: chromosome segregation protein SMC, partial [Bacteroidota bacterium]